MSKYLLSLLLVLMAIVPVLSQRPAALVRKGDAAMIAQDHYSALHYFQLALERKPAPDIYYRIGEAARQFKAYELASYHYGQVMKTTAILQFPTAFLGKAQSELSLGNYRLADSLAQVFLDTGQGSPVQDIQAKAISNSAQWALGQSVDSQWHVERLGRRINTPYGEFAPFIQGDSLYYTSYRYNKEDDRYDPPRKVSKVLFTLDGRRGRILGRNFNVDTAHTANIAINRSGDQLYFTRCQFSEGAAIRCKLCVRGKDRRGRWERSYRPLPATINMPGFSATQPTLRWDEEQQQEYLLFASDRPGGQGAYDIWEVAIPAKGSSWKTPAALSAINSPAADMTPQYYATEDALYFSSNRAPGFGGYDLLKATRNTVGEWAVVENLGAGINSSYDDNYPFVVDSTQLYFSSNRPGGRYLDRESKTCCPDLFLANRILPIPAVVDTTAIDTNAIAVQPPTPILPNTPKPIQSYRSLEEFLPLALYFDNDQPNPRTRQSTTTLSYEDTYYTYLQREDTYYDQFTDEEDTQEAVADFFENAVAAGFAKLDRFSEILLEQLQTGKTVEIFLKGYTSPRARGDYNLLLGKRRVSSVRNHFTNWQRGILQPYIDGKQLIISEVSFGETRAAAGTQDEKAGERLSIYSPEAARERRVEIVEIRKE